MFLGPPGAGKGTQAARLKERLRVPAIVTGLIFREAIGAGSAMGKQVAQFVNAGMLVPDKLTIAVVNDRLSKKDCKEGFILDGYPRTLAQAKALDLYLARHKRILEKVLYFKVDFPVVVERMSHRRICSQCGRTYNQITQPPAVAGRCGECQGALVTRTDDTPEAIQRRLKVYEESTRPLLDYYTKKGILKILDASQKVEAVQATVLKTFGLS